MSDNRVQIALDDGRPPHCANARLRLTDRVERRSFVEERRLRRVQEVDQLPALAIILLGLAAGWQRNPGSLGKLAERVGKLEVFGPHHEREDVAAGAAAEAVIETLFRRRRTTGSSRREMDRGP